MEFDVIKDSGKKVRLEYTSDTGEDKVVTRLESADRPHPDFTKALGALAAPMRVALGLPKDFEISIRKVSVTFDSENGDASGLTISATHDVANSNRPLNVNTPLLDLESYPKFDALLETLFNEAELYATRKKREQLELKPAA